VTQIRKIIHIDMDAFYAAVEQRDFPQYRGKPIVVGGPPNSRGVVATCSYEAREFGIHSAMPSAHAYRLCPSAIFVRPRFDAYRRISREIQSLFREYAEAVEPLSLDEAYLDVSAGTRCRGSATLVAKAIKQRIREETELTASAGVSYNKFLAKIASDLDKPDGLYLITPEQGPEFVAGLPIGKFFGVGAATERRMFEHGIRTGADLRKWALVDLQRVFGKAAEYYYGAARGLDERPVASDQIRKSIGTETTFQSDIGDVETMLQHLSRLAQSVAGSIGKRELAGRTLTVKVKYQDFVQVTRSITVDPPLRSAREMMPLVRRLLARTDAGQRKVRLLGVTLSNLTDPSQEVYQEQLELFDDPGTKTSP
jgi:DNA polymerase-4